MSKIVFCFIVIHLENNNKCIFYYHLIFYTKDDNYAFKAKFLLFQRNFYPLMHIFPSFYGKSDDFSKHLTMFFC